MSISLRQVTILFLMDNDQILLAMKKRGFGEGLWNGVGGKLDVGETIEQALIRETNEEIGVIPQSFHKVAVLDFRYPEGSERTKDNQQAHVFLCEKWSGKPIETEEMKPVWHSLDSIPYDIMWPDDKLWLPEVLKGNKVSALFGFDVEDNLVSSSVKKVKDF
jgi:mutator protein MutT